MQGGVILGPVDHSVPLLGNVAATGCLGFERHDRDLSIRKGAVVLRRPAPDANRPIRATSVDAPLRARENIRNAVTRRSDAAICPASCAVMDRRPAWEFAERVQIKVA